MCQRRTQALSSDCFHTSWSTRARALGILLTNFQLSGLHRPPILMALNTTRARLDWMDSKRDVSSAS